MKTTYNIFITLIILSISGMVYSQESNSRIPTLGENAPSFKAESTNGLIRYPDDFYNKWRIIFSHPAGFTPVCTSELIELAQLQEEFKNLKAEIIVISTDGVNSNTEWIKSMERLIYKGKETPKITYPIVSDIGLEISHKYGMQHPVISNTKNVRGVFIIDPENKIRLLEFYPMTIGRNINEIKRALIALQEIDKQSVYTPANWIPGEDVLIPSPESQEAFEKKVAKKKDDEYYLSWYMWFKKAK